MNNPDLNVPYDELNDAIIQELRVLGLKNGLFPKRTTKGNQSSKPVTSQGFVFRKSLYLLPFKRVRRLSGIETEVPTFIHDVCCYIAQNATIEGIFRKGGSAARQKEIRALLDRGQSVTLSEHHVVDIANILKYFLRELPQPLLPFAFHDLFLQCLLLEDTVEAVLLVCLLLPRLNMNILAYLMEFFHLVSEQSDSNKMTHRNLAIVVTPSLMPISEKISVCQNPQRVDAHVRIVEILISHADRIGVLPDGVIGKLSLAPSLGNLSILSDDQGNGIAVSSKKKRRRSGSLTRMFNGLKKIVGSKASPGIELDHSGIEEESCPVVSSSEISTPCVKSAIKRKALDATAAFSSKKKKDVLKALPQSTALADTPFKKSSTTFSSESNNTKVCPHPNPATGLKSKSKSPQKNKNRRFFVTRTYSETDNTSLGSHSKKGISGVSNFVIKKQKQRLRHSASGNFLERSWSAVSSSNWGRRKQRPSDPARFSVLTNSASYMPVECDSSDDGDVGIDLSQEEPLDCSLPVFVDKSPTSFVQVPKSEYEDLKSRMSAIESCISHEFSNVTNLESKTSPRNINAANTVLAVQTVYEKTLEDADVCKDTSADQLAKRLSRELKIRRSSDSKVIRSPSARKIGSIRRRSREKQSPSLRRDLRRNKSWHLMPQSGNASASTPLVHCSRLRRGRPNTVFSGLPHPTPNLAMKEIKLHDKVPILGADESPVGSGSITRSQTRRASSFHGSEVSSPSLPSSKKTRSQVNIAKAALLAHAQQKIKGRVEQDGLWYDAEKLLTSSKDLLSVIPSTGRESIAKLRCENAGKVLATAKLFSGNQECPKHADSRRSKVHDGLPLRASLDNNQELMSGKPGHQLNRPNHPVMEELSGSQSKLDTHCSSPLARGSHSFTIKPSATVKKSNIEQSPAVVTLTKKVRERSSPSQSPKAKNVSCKVKKHSSMKVDRVIHSQPVKRNLSVPVQLIDSGKENHIDNSLSVSPMPRYLSPRVEKESGHHTERQQRISASPLKDCNRISVQTRNQRVSKYPQGKSCTTPNIKQPLTVHTPSRKAFTPQSSRICSAHTPLKVLASSSITPHHSTQQRPSRLKYSTKASFKSSRLSD